MADFKIAHAITAKNEGGYANNPADRGGETHLGIARRFHPNWPGWQIVDTLKKQVGFPGTANNSAQLKALAANFYKVQFWDILKLDSVADQLLANAVYDFGVNAGPGRSATLLQQAANVTNRNSGTNLVVDGKIGPATVAVLNAHPTPALLRKAFAIKRGSFYLTLAENSPTQEVFVASWLSRITL
ncbi:glycoside hydrolase family 108 protein [Hymenobacter metallilatus]|uniref:Uncharacterized protein n=1 Tax=Hymenobacter metallilatus TaxID=2493666 RepID=A0A428JCZ5_9BACT|nr:glycosyl hydrolase 108 family protein [Hymenobacter metallilatus]RSK29836.1 hypothetical protein EI290_15995 [Hymenobacter metallilatus]